jgi:hypothetical protein
MRLRNDTAIDIFNKGTAHYQHHLLIHNVLTHSYKQEVTTVFLACG